jgi:hypothetical protein
MIASKKRMPRNFFEGHRQREGSLDSWLEVRWRRPTKRGVTSELVNADGRPERCTARP